MKLGPGGAGRPRGSVISDGGRAWQRKPRINRDLNHGDFGHNCVWNVVTGQVTVGLSASLASS